MLSTVSIEYHLRSWSGSVRRLEPFSLLHLFDKNTSEWLCGSTSILGSSGCSSIPCLNSALHLQASTQLSLSPFRRGETDQLLKQATTQRGNGQWNSFELCAPSDCMANEFCPAVSKGSPQKKHRLGHWAPFWSLVAAAQWHPSSSVFSPWRSYIVILYTCFLYIHMCIHIYIHIYIFVYIKYIPWHIWFMAQIPPAAWPCSAGAPSPGNLGKIKWYSNSNVDLIFRDNHIVITLEHIDDIAISCVRIRGIYIYISTCMHACMHACMYVYIM